MPDGLRDRAADAWLRAQGWNVRRAMVDGEPVVACVCPACVADDYEEVRDGR